MQLNESFRGSKSFSLPAGLEALLHYSMRLYARMAAGVRYNNARRDNSIPASAEAAINGS
jgi:hypothetical protein